VRKRKTERRGEERERERESESEREREMHTPREDAVVSKQALQVCQVATGL
jgi:hypothetical protein